MRSSSSRDQSRLARVLAGGLARCGLGGPRSGLVHGCLKVRAMRAGGETISPNGGGRAANGGCGGGSGGRDEWRAVERRCPRRRAVAARAVACAGLSPDAPALRAAARPARAAAGRPPAARRARRPGGRRGGSRPCASSASPAAVAWTRCTRASSASASRRTSPSRSSSRTRREMVGGRTCSAVASSPIERGAAEDEHRKRRQARRGEPGGVVLGAQPAQQVDGRGVEPLRQRLGGRRGGGARDGGTRFLGGWFPGGWLPGRWFAGSRFPGGLTAGHGGSYS